MCQDVDKKKDENQSFDSIWNLCMTNEPILQCIIVLRAWFVRHRLNPERTKTFIFGFVFVLAHEQPINPMLFQVPYEQLVLHPRRWMEKILSFLDLPWTEAVMHHEEQINKPHGISLSKVERSSDQVSAGFVTSRHPSKVLDAKA